MLGTSPVSSHPPIAEYWVVPEKEWKDALNDAGIQSEFALDQLDRLNISVCFGQPEHTVKALSSSYFENKNERLLKDYGETQVYYPSHPMTPQHLCVQLTRKVNHLNELSQHERLELQRTVNKVVSLLEEVFHIPCAIIVQYNRPQEEGKLSLEVIAPLSQGQKEFDAEQKVHDNNYIYFRKYSSPLPSEEKKQEIVEIWQKAFHDHPERPEFSLSLENEPFFPWIFTSKNDVARDYRFAESFVDALIERKVPIERTIYQKDHPSENNSLPRNRCAFCTKEIIDSQIIYETPDSLLIGNFKSMQNQMNYLVVSKRHVRSLTQLNQKELVDFQALTQLVLEALEEIYGPSLRCVMLVQDGPSVGQTECHVHMHVHANSNDLRFPLHYMNYREKKPLTPEEMRSGIEAMREKILEIVKRKEGGAF